LVEYDGLDLVVLPEDLLETVEHLDLLLAGQFESENAVELLFVLTLNFIHGKGEFFSL
jgi:hypothetical protein